MGWMIGAIVVLLVTNALAIWAALKSRKQAQRAEAARWQHYEDDYRRESRLRCAVWELRGDGWRENMAWCGGGYDPHMSTIDHAIMFMEELTGRRLNERLTGFDAPGDESGDEVDVAETAADIVPGFVK